MKARQKLSIALCLVGLGLISLPGSASAAVTFGADLSQVPQTNCNNCAA